MQKGSNVIGASGKTSWDIAKENEALKDTDAYRRLKEGHGQHLLEVNA